MSKKKKLITIIVAIVLVVAAVVLAVIFLTPKADLMAPYENFYTVVNDERLEKIENNNLKLIEYMTDFEEDSLKTEAQKYLEKYTYSRDLFEAYRESNQFIETNIMYLTDHDHKLVDLQRKVTNKHKDVLACYEACTTYITTDIEPIKAQNKQNTWTMMNSIKSYDSLFMNFLSEFASFYRLTSDLFEAYTISTINANPYTRQFVKSTMVWADCITTNIVSGELDGTKEGCINLKRFATASFTSSANMYFTNFEIFNEMLGKINALDESFYEALASNQTDAYIEALSNEQEKQNIEEVLVSFFEFEAKPPVEPGDGEIVEGGEE